MTQPGYQEGSEPMWWWKVALHLDEAQLALANAMAHNLDDQRPVFALQDKLREGQAILLEIFRAKGLLPGSTNGRIGSMADRSLAEMPMPGSPPPLWPFPPGVPAPDMMPFPVAPSVDAVTVAVAPVPVVEQPPPLVALSEPAVIEADQTTIELGSEQPTAVDPAEAAAFAPSAAITPAASNAASPVETDPGGRGG